MGDAGRRRFTLLDLMSFIAATAGGLAVARWSLPEALSLVGYVGGANRLPLRVLYGLLVIVGSWPVAASWSLAWIASRMGNPRPRWRVLARRPGTTAAVASLLGGAIGALLLIPFLIGDEPGLWGLCTALPVGYAVAASWLNQVLGRRWRPSPDAFDRLGRLIGVYWIAMIPVVGLVLAALL